mmetsp:Transcript_417/g.992  ORF Transcript_417/g.992 Transcript_417/m.992 type:complete len:299 (-) Transcript_417:1968-2864(-)
MGAHTSSLAAIHQDILIISIHAFNDSQQARRHTNALQVSPKSFPRNCIVCLLEINKSCMQPWGCIWALDLSSMLQVPQNESGLQSVTARIETKLSVWNLVFIFTPPSDHLPKNVSIQPVQGATYCEHAIIPWVQHRALLVKRSYLSHFPTSRNLSPLHHGSKQTCNVRSQNIHPIRASTINCWDPLFSVLSEGCSNSIKTRGCPSIQLTHVLANNRVQGSCIRQFHHIRFRHPPRLSTLTEKLLRRRVVAPQGHYHIPSWSSRVASPTCSNPLCHPTHSSNNGLHPSANAVPHSRPST